VLGNIVSLSDIRVDELMRPRTQFLAFRPPVSLDDLQGKIPPSGYLLMTEAESDDVAAAIPLKYLSDIPANQLEHHAVPVVYVPWCAPASAALEEMRLRDRKVAAVVNEFGETIGILTFDDLLATIFTDSPSRSARLLRTSPIAQAQPGIWHVTGMTSLRRLARYFQVELPETHNVTVAGVTQEVLQRLPARGDEVAWGPFRWTVLDAPERGQLTVELTLRQEVPE
jgi:CBS domain containing-hemolysin-like protein